MNTQAATLQSASNRFALRGILLGGLFAGFVDFVYPTVSTILNGGAWTQPWKGVASGLLGAAAREGGLGMVALGIALHFFICIGAAALLYLVVSRVKWLPRSWVLIGILHGLAVLATMNYVILPLSAIGRGIYPLATLHVTALAHILVVGLPTAYFVTRAIRKAELNA
jgi:hypothetical protein